MGRLRFALVAALVIGLDGCGGDPEPNYKPPPQLTIRASEAGPGRFRLSVPDSIPSGVVRIQLANGGNRSHQAQLIRVDGAHPLSEVVAALRVALRRGPLAPWLHFAGGVGTTMPGETTTTFQELAPGSYYAVDTSSTEGDGRGTRYFERGAIARFRISGQGGAAVAPATPSHVAAIDYDFRAQHLRAGKNLVRFENAGKEPHHLFMAPIRSGRTIEDVRSVFRRGAPSDTSTGSAALDLRSARETAVLAAGKGQVTELSLNRGRYALVCFVADASGGPPHVVKGMVTEVGLR
jgi:hypothetical protein